MKKNTPTSYEKGFKAGIICGFEAVVRMSKKEIEEYKKTKG